jgi:hypothetical protein
MPASLSEPIWDQFCALLPARTEFDPTHPLGCHRRRLPERTVFAPLGAALVHGSGYQRIASHGCSDRTVRRRVAEWARLGIAAQVPALTLAAYARMLGLDLDDLAVDGASTQAPCPGDQAGPSPVDRAQQGLTRSTLVDGDGSPLGLVSAGAHRHDSTLLAPALRAATPQLGALPRNAVVPLDSA